MRKFAPLFFAVLLLVFITGIAQAFPISEDGTGLVPDNTWTNSEVYTFMGGVTLEAGTYNLVFELNGSALFKATGNPQTNSDKVYVEALADGIVIASTNEIVAGTSPVPFTMVLQIAFQATTTVNLTINSWSVVSDPATEEWQVDSATLGKTVDFIASTTSGKAPLTVNFSDQSTGATSWSWDFGDGSTSTEQNPAHTYTDRGTYTVSLTATGPVGSDTRTKTDYITATQYDFSDVATSAVFANMYFSPSIAYSGYAIDDSQYYSLAQLYAQSARDYAEAAYEQASDALTAGASFWGTYATQYAQFELSARSEALTYIDLAVQYATAGDYDTAEYYLGYSLGISATANLYNGSVIWCASMESAGATE